LSSSIGNIYSTQIPDYTEAADIQAALKLYHYGSTTVPTVKQIGGTGGIVANSVAGHLEALDDRVAVVEAAGVGSFYGPTGDLPATPVDNFIWVDSNSSVSAIVGTVAAYQNDAPTTGLVDGLLWVDKNSSPLKMYVYDAGLATWKEIGA
jgi:hypothetical protein